MTWGKVFFVQRDARKNRPFTKTLTYLKCIRSNYPIASRSTRHERITSNAKAFDFTINTLSAIPLRSLYLLLKIAFRQMAKSYITETCQD